MNPRILCLSISIISTTIFVYNAVTGTMDWFLVETTTAISSVAEQQQANVFVLTDNKKHDNPQQHQTGTTRSLRGIFNKGSPHEEGAPSSPRRQELLKEWHNFNPQVLQEQAKKLPDFIKGQYNYTATSSKSNNKKTHDVIVATHTSIDNDKLNRVDILQQYWQGPISLAIRIRSQTEINQFFDYYEQLPTNMTNQWTVHFLFEKLDKDIDPNSHAAQYCHNTLRNLAMHSPSIPDFVLGLDLDFVPAYGSYPKLMQILQEYPKMWDKMKQDKILFVIPVMEVLHIPDSWGMNSKNLAETLRQIDSITSSQDRTPAQEKLIQDLQNLEIYERGVESDLPKSREDLEILYKYNAAREWHHKPGHAPSNLVKYWEYKNPSGGGTNNIKSDSNPQPSYSIEKPSYKYEPYYIGYKPAMPKYWEGFRGYGLDKQSWVRECLLAGFQMEALYELYLTHLAHPSNVNRKIKQFNQKEWDNEFQFYLEKNYPKPAFDPKGEWWYSDPNSRPNRKKYVTTLRAEQYGD